jgi:hypothetical protein
MKKILLSSLLFLGFSGVSEAQIEAGTMIAGGSAYFNHYRSSSTVKSTSLMIAPQFGLAFADNFIAGAQVNINSFSSTSNWQVSPFVRYYAQNAFLQLRYGYSRSGSSGQSTLGADLGYAIFVNKNVAIEPAFYYERYLSAPTGANLGMKIGLQFYFNRK